MKVKEEPPFHHGLVFGSVCVLTFTHWLQGIRSPKSAASSLFLDLFKHSFSSRPCFLTHTLDAVNLKLIWSSYFSFLLQLITC